MTILNTRLACSLCGVGSTVGEIGYHLVQFHIGSGDSDWLCSNGCLYRTANKVDMASHCLITRHPANELTRPLTFPQMLAAVQRQFCPVVSDFPDLFGLRTQDMSDDESHSDEHDDIEKQETEQLDQKRTESEGVALLMVFPPKSSASIAEPEYCTSLTPANVMSNVQNSESKEEELPETELESPRSPEQSDNDNISGTTLSFCRNMTFNCDYCALSFGRKDCLKRHTQELHKSGIGNPESVSLESQEVNSESEEEEPPDSGLESPKSPEQSDENSFSGPWRPKHFQCDYCGYIAVSRANLIEHIHRKHTFERPFHCQQPQCTYIAVAKADLKHHDRTHTVKKPFTCLTCHNSLATAFTLRQHQRTHTGERPFTCSFCHKSFAHKITLRKHQTRHTGEKPFKCQLCHYTAVTKNMIYLHKLTHTGKRSFSCSTCHKSFVRPTTLRFHQRTHTGEKPYKCATCLTGFALKSDLQSHIYRVCFGKLEKLT